MNILVTGGSKGLGAAIVKRLAANKANHVSFTFSASEDAARKLSDEFDNVDAIHCNFSNQKSVDDLVVKLSSMNLNVLINNAYLPFVKEHFHKANPDRYLKSFELNVLPVLRITQAAITEFRKAKFGKIINILSTAVIGNPPVGWSEYAANKNYILSMSKSWATENIRFNISSNCVSPGFMKTDFTNDTDERIIEQIIASHPLKKLTEPEEVAETVLFLSQCSQQINGINLVMNAGENIL